MFDNLYSSNADVSQIGEDGINKLKKASVLVIGAGGMGCNVLVHLAGSGIGKIGVCDFDSVSETNFNRQFLYSVFEIGKNKAECAVKSLMNYAPNTEFMTCTEKIKENNAAEIIKGFDLVIIACDNNKTRLTVNRACVKLNIPFIDTGVAGLFGNIYFYVPEKTACLECFLSEENDSVAKSTVSSAVGVIGGLASLLAVRYFSDETFSDYGILFSVDLISMQIDRLCIKPSSGCKVCMEASKNE